MTAIPVPTLADVAAAFGTAETMTEEEARNYAGPLVMVLCPADRPVPVNTDCANGCISPSCENCPGLEAVDG